MTEAEIKKLVEGAVSEATGNANKLLEARALRGDAMIAANKIMSTLALPDAAKARVMERVTVAESIPVKEGAIDTAKFTDLVMVEARNEAAYLTQIDPRIGRVMGMGPSGTAPQEQDPAKLREAEKWERKQAKRLRESENAIFTQLMGNPKAAEFAVSKGEAA